MKEILKNMNKKTILIACVITLIGVIFTFVDIGTTICYILAGACFLFGILNVIAYFQKSHTVGNELVLGLCAILIGVFICIYAKKVVEILTFIFGATLIIFGVLRLQNTIDIARLKKKSWPFELLCSVALISVGCIASLKPDLIGKAINIFIGVSFIVLGITYFITAFRLDKAVRDLDKESYIEVTEADEEN